MNTYEIEFIVSRKEKVCVEALDEAHAFEVADYMIATRGSPFEENDEEDFETLAEELEMVEAKELAI